MENTQRLFVLTTNPEQLSDLALRNGSLTDISETFKDGKLFPPNTQRLINFSTCTQDVSDTPLCDSFETSLSKPLVHWDLLFPPNPQRLVQLPTHYENRGNSTFCNCPPSIISQARKRRQLTFPNLKRFIKLPLSFQNFSHLSGGNRCTTQVFQSGKDGQLFLYPNTQRLFKLATDLQHVGDPSPRDSSGVFRSSALMKRQFDTLPMGECAVIVAQVKQQAAQFIQRGHHQIIWRIGMYMHPCLDFGNAPMAVHHAATIHAVPRGQAWAVCRRRPERFREVHRAALREDIDTTSPSP